MRSCNIMSFEKLVVFLFILFVTTSLTQAKIIIDLAENFENKKIGFSRDQIKLFEKDLREKTGLQSLSFNLDGELDYDFWENAKFGSLKLREAITGAIDDELEVFQIINYSNSKKIHFAQIDAGTVDVNTRIKTYNLMFDLADFRSAKHFSDKVALDSFTLALNLFHEIDHKASYDIERPLGKFFARPEVSFGSIMGVRENTNYIRSELGLILRDTSQMSGRRFSDDIYEIYFRNEFGRRKFLRWKIV